MIVRNFVEKGLGYSYHISPCRKNLGLYCTDCMWTSCRVELIGYCVLPNGRTYLCRGTKTARSRGSFECFPIRGEDLEDNLNLFFRLAGVHPAVVKEFLHCVTRIYRRRNACLPKKEFLIGHTFRCRGVPS